MTNITKELAHSFNITFTNEISGKIKKEQEKLLKLFSERRFYDSSPHLAIATKFMENDMTETFKNTLNREFENDAAWELEFADFRQSETQDYIFLHLNPESRQKLLDLHERTFQVTKEIGLEIQSGNKFRHFEYDPHISIIKLGTEEIGNALATLNNDFRRVRMPVNRYQITRQEDIENGFSNFPIIAEISLK